MQVVVGEDVAEASRFIEELCVAKDIEVIETTTAQRHAPNPQHRTLITTITPHPKYVEVIVHSNGITHTQMQPLISPSGP